jgi:anti-sigma regulatory factor (Ser/Thr protein kinase)
MIDGDQHGWRLPVAMEVADSGLPDDRVQDFLVAVTEMVANAMQHGDNRAELALWVAAAGVVCDVYDQGQGLDDPLAGFLPPGGDDAPKGIGLWVARQLSDTLAISSGPDGTVVRLTIAR